MTAGDRVRGIAAQQLRCHLPSGGKEIPTEETTGVGRGGVLSPSHGLVARAGSGSRCLAAAGPSPWQYHPSSAPASLLLSTGIRLYLPKGHLAQGPALRVDIPHIPWSSQETVGPRFQP